MSRRIVAPILLFVAAALSIAAVFAVHQIEAGGGPLSEPSVTTYFSPNDDGVQDVAEIRFTTQRPERITIRLIDASGETVRTLLRARRINGSHIAKWDGRTDDGTMAEDGAYDVRITRGGDARVYAPTRPITLDTIAPIGRLDRGLYIDGELRGLTFLEPGVTVEVTDAAGEPITANMRSFPGTPGSEAARASGPVPPGTRPVRFVVPIDATKTPIDSLGINAVDLAGNRTDLRGAADAGDVRVWQR